MKLTLEVENNARMTFENVSEEQLSGVVLGLLGSQGLGLVTPIGNNQKPNPAGDPRPASLVVGRAGSPRTKDASKRALAIASEVLGDGEWHPKWELVAAWERAGLNPSTADRAITRLDALERAMRGRKAWWRLTASVIHDPEEACFQYHGTANGHG